MRILVVEDDEPIAEVIRIGLEEAGYSVELAYDGKDGLDLGLMQPYAVIILDIMLPGLDGWRVCKELRNNRVTTPVLMLTARDAVDDRVKGLDLGADDYLPKPFEFAELLARVRSLLRRDRVHKTRVFRIADLEVDTGARVVRRGGEIINLTPKEYELLEALAANEGRVLTREAIQDRVWMDEPAISNTVDVRVGLLRKKVDSGREPKLIHTVHGVGYSLHAPREG